MAKPALAPLHGPRGRGDSEFCERTVSILLSSRSCQAGTTKEGGKAGAVSLLRMQPLPPAPTRPALCKRTFSPHHSPRAAGGPRGLAQLGDRGQGGKGAQGLSGPTEAEEGKGNCRAVAQHKMRQQSKGQTARNHLAEERGHKCTVPGRPRADHRGRGRRVETRSDTDPKGERKPYVEHRPLRRAGEIYGRAGTVGTEPGVGEGARWTQEVAPNGAHSRPFQSGWWQQEERV